MMIDPEPLRLGLLMTRMNEQHGDITVDLEVSGVAQCISGVESGRLDGAFFGGPKPHQALAVWPLATLRYRVIAPPAWTHLRETVNWNSLGLMPWIRAPRPSAHHEMVDHIFRHASISPMKILHVDHESVIMSLVRAGLGLSLVREDLALAAEARGEAIVCTFAQTVELPLSFIYRRDRRAEAGLNTLIQVLTCIWSDQE